MTLTQANKDFIDSLGYEALLRHWRYAPIGDPWFDGETGSYWSERMKALREAPGGNARHVSASKTLG